MQRKLQSLGPGSTPQASISTMHSAPLRKELPTRSCKVKAEGPESARDSAQLSRRPRDRKPDPAAAETPFVPSRAALSAAKAFARPLHPGRSPSTDTAAPTHVAVPPLLPSKDIPEDEIQGLLGRK